MAQVWVKWVRQFYRKIRPEVAVTSQTAGNKNSQASFHVNSKFPFSKSWSSSPLVETTAAVKLKVWLLMIVGLRSLKFVGQKWRWKNFRFYQCNDKSKKKHVWIKSDQVRFWQIWDRADNCNSFMHFWNKFLLQTDRVQLFVM